MVVGSGSSFYFAMRLLPRDKREAMFAVYAFCREVDDIADDRQPSAASASAMPRPIPRLAPVTSAVRPDSPMSVPGPRDGSRRGDYFDVENPATGETVARMANAGAEDVAEAVSAAEQADAEALFYLMSRGLRREQAERLVVLGFLGEVLSRLPLGGVAEIAELLRERGGWINRDKPSLRSIMCSPKRHEGESDPTPINQSALNSTP